MTEFQIEIPKKKKKKKCCVASRVQILGTENQAGNSVNIPL